MRKGERFFSDAAVATATKFPNKGFLFLTPLLGQMMDSPIVKRYQERYPHHNLKADPERGTVVFHIDDETFFSVEELVAMVLEHAMELVSEFAEQPVSDAVITVPPFFTQAERKAVLL